MGITLLTIKTESADLVVDEFGHAILFIPDQEHPYAQVFEINRLHIEKVMELLPNDFEEEQTHL